MRKIKGIVATVLSLGMIMASSLTSLAAELPEQRSGEAVSIESTANQTYFVDPDYVEQKRYVKGNGVRLRREPGDGEIVGLLYENAKDWVKLSGEIDEVDDKWWVKVIDSSTGYTGWMAEEYLKSYGPSN